MLEVGEEAPDFTLPDGDGASVSLRDLRGQPVVVYFYPKDDTPGCTTQACGIRDAWAEFEALGAEVLGISPDDPESHARFRDKYDLPHTLLADPDAAVIGSYGAWGRVRYRDKEYDGVIRMTVLIDEDGRVARVWPKVRPDEHAEDVLAAIRDLEPMG
jgi:thioredoxin-dependent peroxiredoxin